MHKKTIIIRVVNGLAFTMVTVFEDFFQNYFSKFRRFTFFGGKKEKAVKKKASQCDTHEPKKMVFMLTAS